MWKLNEGEPTRFARNPLELVVAQLRFHQILKVPDRAADFQDLVRDEFPVFEPRSVNEVILGPGTEQVTKSQQQQFGFRDSAMTTVISLASDSLAIETSVYSHHELFLGSFRKALDALLKVFGHVAPTRLGLRYVNAINRNAIGEALGREVWWDELVSEQLLKVAGPAGLDETAFKAEITAPIQPGEMTFRHGMVQPPDQVAQYRLDIDRYQRGSFGVETCNEKLVGFSDDCFNLFRQVAGAGLEEWMSPAEALEEVADA